MEKDHTREDIEAPGEVLLAAARQIVKDNLGDPDSACHLIVMASVDPKLEEVFDAYEHSDSNEDFDRAYDAAIDYGDHLEGDPKLCEQDWKEVLEAVGLSR